jgi:DNA (cytosine-5)-methyltransferase 1
VNKQLILDIHNKLIVDLFAGGGGMSVAFETAFGRSPDIAINHNDDALSMHRINHPLTRHFIADVFEVCPRTVTQGRPVGHLHLSPDCTHHSQARGGQTRNEKVRALSWVGKRWAGQVKPRVITLENVHQVELWGPLIAKRDPATGRVITLEMIDDPITGKKVHRVADKGERVPRELQYLVPDPKRKGRTWRAFIRELEHMGYEVKCTRMRASDFGAGTSRSRLFMHARCDGKPVTFPEPNHHKKPKRGQKPWHQAHEYIDFSIESQSIFDRKKPLKPNTLKRIAKGIKRFVLDSADPFIVSVTNSSSSSVHSIRSPVPVITTAKGGEFALATPYIVPMTHQGDDGRVYELKDPINTITGANRGEFAIASPVMIQAGHGEGKPDGVKRWGEGSKDIRDLVGTITGSGDQALATAYLAQMNGGFYEGAGNDLRDSVSTITNSGSQQQLVTAFLSRQFGTSIGHGANEPHGTFTAEGGGKSALIECTLSPEDEAKALRVAAFMMCYYGTDNVHDARDPFPTITTKDRLALVTVYYKGTPYVIVDIKLRMLTPRELFAAQGFGPHYIITHGHDGRKFSNSKQVKMCGNSVSPYPAAALYAHCHMDDDMRLVA